MKSVDIESEEPGLQKLVEEVSFGEEVVFKKDGKPCARLSPIPRVDESDPRPVGFMKGPIPAKPGFWDRDMETENDFWNSEIFPRKE